MAGPRGGLLAVGAARRRSPEPLRYSFSVPSVGSVALVAALLVASGCSGGATGSTAPASKPPAATSSTLPTTAHAPSPTTTTVPAPKSTTTTVPAPTPTECLAAAPISGLVGQIVIATVTEPAIVKLVDVVVDGTIGGIVLLENADSGVGEALLPLSEAGITPIIGVDEEGGAVQRLGPVLGIAPSARRLGNAGNIDSTFFAGAKRATGAAHLGFNMVFAPVLDVGRSAGTRSRAYGDDPETVIEEGLAYAAGLDAGGVVPVAKHFPGHGSTGADSHLGLPVTKPIADLESFDLLPFAAAAQSESVPAIMVGHLVVPDLTDGMPASLSPAAIDMLRSDYGFDGLVVTDDLSMGALRKWTIPEAAELALLAGDDLLIAGGLSDSLDTVERLVDAVDSGRVDRTRLEDAAARVLAVKGVDPCQAWPT